MKKTSIGGQAVVEGVMMRGKSSYAMAIQTETKGLVIEKKEIENKLGKHSIFRLPIFRGMYAFFESLVFGSKIIMRSAEIASDGLEDGDEPASKFEIFLYELFGDKLANIVLYFGVFCSLVLCIGLFMLLPVWIGSFFKDVIPGTWALSIIEGVARMAIFLAYMYLISRMKDIQRVFQYHGAEHKTINCFESGDELTVENVHKHTRLHKRCGTSFLFLVMLISIIIFFFVHTDTLWLRFVSRILLVPFVAGISYEVLKWAGRSDSTFVNIVSAPGLWLQKWTTKEPDDKQIEAAIAALEGVLEDED